MHLKMETGMAAIKPDTLGSAKVGQRKSGQVKVADGGGLAKCDIYQLHRRQSAYGSDDIARILFFFYAKPDICCVPGLERCPSYFSPGMSDGTLPESFGFISLLHLVNSP